MKKDQYVVRRGNEWAVVGANNKRATKVASTQKEAIGVATRIAKNNKAEVRIQDRSGHFKKCNSYGNDACPPQDKNY